jgi:cytochrome c-type biogenesis protein CcmH
MRLLLLLFLSLMLMGFEDKPLSDDELEQRAMELFERLGCPVCEGQSLGGSSSDLATSIRNVVREKLSEGMSEEEAVRYLELRYGERIRLSPKFEGGKVVVWMLPVLIFVALCIFIVFRARSFRGD